MEKIVISSIKENFFQRAKNPLISLWIFIILFHKWDIIYKILKFAHLDKPIEDKITLINGALSSLFNPYDLFRDLVYAFLILILTHLLGVLSRFLSDFFNKNITPYCEEINDKIKSISKKYSSQDYQALLNRYHLLKEKAKRLESEIEQLEEERNKLYLHADKINLDLLGKDEEEKEVRGSAYEGRIDRSKTYIDKLLEATEPEQVSDEGKTLRRLILNIDEAYKRYNETKKKFDTFSFFFSIYRLYNNLKFNNNLLTHLKIGQFQIQNVELIDSFLTLLILFNRNHFTDKIHLLRHIETIDVSRVKNNLFHDIDHQDLPNYITTKKNL